MSVAHDAAAVLGLEIEWASPSGYAITSPVSEAAIFDLVKQGKIEWQDSADPYCTSAGSGEQLLFVVVTVKCEDGELEVECAVDVEGRFLYVV